MTRPSPRRPSQRPAKGALLPRFRPDVAELAEAAQLAQQVRAADLSLELPGRNLPALEGAPGEPLAALDGPDASLLSPASETIPRSGRNARGELL
jgi:hypothetical protein